MKGIARRLRSSLLADAFCFISLITLSCMYPAKGHSQIGGGIANFVPNGGYEETGNCTFPLPKHWRCLDSISCGMIYSSTCNNSVPQNGFTYQWPKNGNTYMLAGFLCIPPACAVNFNRAYLRNRLKSNLQQGKSYCVKFYVNISNNSTYGIDGFGAYFCDNSIDTITQSNIPLTYLYPQVQNPNGNIVIDTLNWTLVSGTFIATGSEKFLLIGNFKSDAATNKICINPTSTIGIGTDVCVDQVSCIDIDLPAYAGPDKWFLPGDSVYIGRESDIEIDESCIWYKMTSPTTSVTIDTIAGLWVKPVATTTYVVRQQLWCSGVKWDTVVVSLSGVGLNELQAIENDISVFPNPASDYLQFQYTLDISDPFIGCTIYNSLGQIMREDAMEFRNKKARIQINDLNNGVYSIELKNSSGQLIKRRFVVAR
ncbi:MAG TPA: T9SS type A sorting domain-containing protein [Bacteroidia bacterium]|nr:T9SS type A sorting domain-containing protein [Bacteroidia bacterium]